MDTSALRRGWVLSARRWVCIKGNPMAQELEPEVDLERSLPATPGESADPRAPIPKQIRYIIGNEGCERFSFYGMRNILTVFLVSSLLLYLPESEREIGAKDVFHTF